MCPKVLSLVLPSNLGAHGAPKALAATERTQKTSWYQNDLPTRLKIIGTKAKKEEVKQEFSLKPMADARMGFGRRKRKRVSFVGQAKAPRRRIMKARLPGGELKFFDTLKAATTVTETGTILDDSLVHIPQGVTESERVGRKCTLRSIHIKGTFLNSNVTSVNDTKNGVRIIMYLDKQANGATAAVSDVLEDITEVNGYNSFRNLSNSYSSCAYLNTY